MQVQSILFDTSINFKKRRSVEITNLYLIKSGQHVTYRSILKVIIKTLIIYSNQKNTKETRNKMMQLYTRKLVQNFHILNGIILIIIMEETKYVHIVLVLNHKFHTIILYHLLHKGSVSRFILIFVDFPEVLRRCNVHRPLFRIICCSKVGHTGDLLLTCTSLSNPLTILLVSFIPLTRIDPLTSSSISLSQTQVL